MKMISLQTTIIAAAIALATGGIAGSLTAWSLTKNHYVAKIETQQREASEQARVAEQKLNTTVANLNFDSAKVLNQVSTAFQEKLNAAEKKYADVAALIGDGTYSLRDPGSSGSCEVPEDRGSAATTSNHGQAGGKLSAKATRFLLGRSRASRPHYRRTSSLPGNSHGLLEAHQQVWSGD
ncbi:Rz-like spanin [Achromobacter phage 2-1]|nr:Rz-like spanin [Achromobacter phage 2-1]